MPLIPARHSSQEEIGLRVGPRWIGCERCSSTIGSLHAYEQGILFLVTVRLPPVGPEACIAHLSLHSEAVGHPIHHRRRLGPLCAPRCGVFRQHGMARPARSRHRCGGGEPSPGADAGRVEPHLGANVTGASPAPAAQPSPRRMALRDGANANDLFVQSLSWIHVGLNFFWCVTHGVVPPLAAALALSVPLSRLSVPLS